jgi:hypothetical protein
MILTKNVRNPMIFEVPVTTGKLSAMTTTDKIRLILSSSGDCKKTLTKNEILKTKVIMLLIRVKCRPSILSVLHPS